MSECKAYRREIEEGADGGALGAGARAHASGCRACGDELRERRTLRALVGGLGKVEAPADFEFRLRARMAAAKADGGRGRLSGTRWLYGFAPVAVAACFVLVSATLYFRQATRPTTIDLPAVASTPAPSGESRQASSVNVEGRAVESKTTVGEVVKESSAEVASSELHKPAHRLNVRGRQSREVASKGERRADAAQNTAVGSLTGARVLRATIPVEASAEPLRVILRDESGAVRVVPMRAVSFGSQNVIVREATIKSSVAAEVGGVW
jgi:hypothetical protein